MSHDDALDALIATAKAHDQPPEGAEDLAWAAFAGNGGGGPDLQSVAEVATAGQGLMIKAVATIAVVSAAAVGIARWSTPEPEPSAAVEPSAVVLAPGPANPVPAVRPPVVDPQPASPPEAVVSAPAPRPDTPRKPASPQPSGTVSASTLAEEARLVGSMWKALDAGDAARALSLAQSHGVRFPDGALELEARGAAVAARCVLGRPTDLRELEALHKAATPSVAKRVSAACGEKP